MPSMPSRTAQRAAFRSKSSGIPRRQISARLYGEQIRSLDSGSSTTGSDSHLPTSSPLIRHFLNTKRRAAAKAAGASRGTKPILVHTATHNGAGFTPANFKSFDTSFSQYKKARGGKGGRRFAGNKTDPCTHRHPQRGRIHTCQLQVL